MIPNNVLLSDYRKVQEVGFRSFFLPFFFPSHCGYLQQGINLLKGRVEGKDRKGKRRKGGKEVGMKGWVEESGERQREGEKERGTK